MSETIEAPRPTKRRGLPWWGWTLIAAGVAMVLIIPVLVVLGMFAYVDHSLPGDERGPAVHRGFGPAAGCRVTASVPRTLLRR